MFDHIDSYRGTRVTPEMIAANVAPCTLAGWIWYCDVHDTHGNADHEAEAFFMANAHEDFYAEDDDFEGCDLMVAPAVDVVDV